MLKLIFMNSKLYYAFRGRQQGKILGEGKKVAFFTF